MLAPVPSLCVCFYHVCVTDTQRLLGNTCSPENDHMSVELQLWFCVVALDLRSVKIPGFGDVNDEKQTNLFGRKHKTVAQVFTTLNLHCKFQHSVLLSSHLTFVKVNLIDPEGRLVALVRFSSGLCVYSSHLFERRGTPWTCYRPITERQTSNPNTHSLLLKHSLLLS